MQEKTLNDLPRDLRMLYTKGFEAYQRENFDYAIEMWTQVLTKEPYVFEIRKSLRTAQAAKSGKAGGFAAKVTGPVDVDGLDSLYILVGGNASNEVGGFNGGGFGGSPSGTGAPVGGGGGGASDVRTQSVFMGEPSLLSRLLVAAGGGGAGALANSSSKANAAGGNAGHEGARAESLGAGNSLGSGGFGGKSGTSSAGGAGGEGGFPYSAGTGDTGEDGHGGGLGAGGEGGHGPFNHPPGWGGGGGGGLYGGGGGGGGSDYTGGESPVNSGGGGGGGGSSLVPPGGTSVVDENSSSTPQVKVEWTIPGTTMFGPDEYTSHAEPPIGLHSEETGAEFECRVDSEEEAAWEPCGAEPAIGPLADGRHRVEARAVNVEGNFDPTPAALEFTVDATAPVITSLTGPSVAESTTDPQPIFTFTAADIAPVHFDCGFDAPLGVCSGEGSARPPMPLTPGEHTFTLTPIDAAGNVGMPVTRTFVVSPTPDQGTTTGGSTANPSTNPAGSTANPSREPVAPTIELGKVRLNAKKGTATVLATVNGPGELRLKGAKARTATKERCDERVNEISFALTLQIY